jgi:hypothetical protein
MSISEEIRAAVRAAKAASEVSADDPFKRVLLEVAEGLTDGFVDARVVGGSGGFWSIQLSPVYRPGLSFSMLDVVLSDSRAEVLGRPPQAASTPQELTAILKRFVTTPTFVASLQELAELSTQPVEGFLRLVPQRISRDDLVLEVAPDAQRTIAEGVGRVLTLQLPLMAKLPFAGTFKSGVPYKVLEAAGYSVTLTQEVAAQEDGTLQIVGRVSR